MASVYLGLGSNMGDRRKYLRDAVKSLIDRSGAALIAESSVLETRAVDFENQPDFLNQVVKISTELGPLELLGLVKDIEHDLGRIYRFSKGPREIDIDILLYDDMVINESMLKVPHPEIMNRAFIMEHLVELDPELRDPVTKKKYSEVLHHGSY